MTTFVASSGPPLPVPVIRKQMTAAAQTVPSGFVDTVVPCVTTIFEVGGTDLANQAGSVRAAKRCVVLVAICFGWTVGDPTTRVRVGVNGNPINGFAVAEFEGSYTTMLLVQVGDLIQVLAEQNSGGDLTLDADISVAILSFL